MDEKQIRAAHGHQVRIEAGIEQAVGELTEARERTIGVGSWGGGTLEVPNGDWILTIDGHTREWSGGAELTVID
jgi:hypothetical protein